MKYSHLFTALSLVAAPVVISSCHEDEPELPDTPNIEIDGPVVDNKTPLSPEDQKEYLEAVALAFMDLTPASDFAELADLVNYCTDHFNEDEYEWDDVEDWAEDAWDALLVKTGSHEEEDYWDRYIYTDYKALVAASNFTGHFEDRGGYWKRTQADDLQFSFKDDRGAKIVATLTTSGGTKEVNIGDFEDYDGGDYNSTSGKWVEYYNNYKTTIAVPAQIDVTLKKDSKTLVHTVVHIDLSSLSGKNFVNSSNISVTQSTDFSNGYKVQLTRGEYSGGKSAACTFVLSNNSGSLFSAAIGADIKGLPQFNSGTWMDDEYDDDDLDLIDGSVTQLAIDVLGKVQVKGSLSDVRKFIDYLDAAEDCSSTDRNGIQTALNKANRLLDLGIYYNGNNVRQAYVSLETVVDEEWNGTKYYDYMPVLNFEDGSSYDSFEAFFNDKDFAGAIRAFKRLANHYADLIDEADRPY